MNAVDFPGKQTGERVLYFAKPHSFFKISAFLKSAIMGVVLFLTCWFLSGAFPLFSSGVRLAGALLLVFFLLGGWWWVENIYKNTEMYITDRRIVKFLAFSPFGHSTRVLFWDDAVKCKTYYKNPLLEKILRVGSIEVHAQSQDRDNVDVDCISYHEDVANYIDKILYIFKNQPSEIATIRPFVAKPKGERY